MFHRNKQRQTKHAHTYIIICFLSLYSVCLNAQDYFNYAKDYARLYVGNVEAQYPMQKYKDSPYYNNDARTYTGKISYYGVEYDNVQLRYDMLKQNVSVVTPTTNIYCLPIQEHIDWFEIEGMRYISITGTSMSASGIPARYAALLCDGTKNGFRLYHPQWKVISGEVAENRVYRKMLSSKDAFFLVFPDGTSHEVNNASDVRKLFPEQKKNIKQFVKDNNLSFKKTYRESSLIMLVESLPGTPVSSKTSASTSSPSLYRNTCDSSLTTTQPHNLTTTQPHNPTTSQPHNLISGIPVLDNNSTSISDARSGEYAASKTYVVPGVKKAKVSIADDHELDEIVVVAGRQSAVKSTSIGSEKFKPDVLKNIPSAFGESDIMKIVLTLPGVTTVGEASSGYNVRGGATDQNLILFNNGTVYNPSHLFGLFTSFNSDMVEDVELFKSSIPAQYGGRISSVLRVQSKEANMRKFCGSASIGVLTSKANLEIPIIKDRVSLLVNGRTTYSDWMMKLLPEKSGYKNGTANFYDYGGVLTAKFSERHRLKIFGYISNDKFSFSTSDNYRYVNRNISAEWRSILGENYTATISAGQDHYDYYNEETKTPSMAARLSFGIDQLWAKLHMRHRLTALNTLSYGLSVQHYDVQAGTYEPVGEYSFINYDKLQNDKALESALYIDYEHTLSEKLTVSAGLRYSMFNVLGPRNVNYYKEGEMPSDNNLISTEYVKGISKTYQAPEIRLSARYSIDDNLSVKAGFNTMHQYIHKVSNTSIMSPTDIWKLSDRNIRPQGGWQVAAGIYKETSDKKYEFSVEAYYKRMTDYLNYRNSAVLLMNHHLETDVISTNGRAHGIELQVKKPQGHLNGWISYCYSRTFLRQDDKRVALPVNDGNWFPTEYDRPHEVKAVLNYKFTERYSFSSNFNYSTGRPTTVPAGQYYDQSTQSVQPFYTERNSFRLPDYMRCDLAFNIEPTHRLTSFLHTSFSIGVYNALARKNAYSIYYIVENGKIQGYKLSVFGTAIPYVSLNIKFN